MSINLILLEKGHTQNVNDSAHSVIARAKKGVNIHHPSQWVTLIEAASTKNPQKIKLMTQNEFFNFKTDLGRVFDPLIKDKTRGKSSQKNIKVSSLKVKEVRFDPPDDQNIYMNLPYLTLPHVFRLFFPVNEGWTRSVNTSSFVLLFSNFHGQQRVQHLYLQV